MLVNTNLLTVKTTLKSALLIGETIIIPVPAAPAYQLGVVSRYRPKMNTSRIILVDRAHTDSWYQITVLQPRKLIIFKTESSQPYTDMLLFVLPPTGIELILHRRR